MRVTLIKQRLVDACDEWLNGGDSINTYPVSYGSPNTEPLNTYVVVAQSASGEIDQARLAKGLLGLDEYWHLAIDIISSHHEPDYLAAETRVASVAQEIIGYVAASARLAYDVLNADGEVERHVDALPGLRSCEIEGYDIESGDSPSAGITAVATLDVLAVCSAS